MIRLTLLFVFLAHVVCSFAATEKLDGMMACSRAAATISMVRDSWTIAQVQDDFEAWVQRGEGFATNPNYVNGVLFLIAQAYATNNPNWPVVAVPICAKIMNEEGT